MRKVIIIEDEQSIGELLELHLNEIPCLVHFFMDGLEGYKYASSNPFDLLVLDINLPSMDGMKICRSLRDAGITSPIMMLTARTGEEDKISGLDFGADDYLTKPFSIREFLARVKAIFRRTELDKEVKTQRILHYKQLEIDPVKRKVAINNSNIELSPTEYDLLFMLASHPGTTFSRKDLLSRVWGEDYSGYEHTVNTHINRLRNKIEKDPDHPVYVMTTWGVGYRFNDE
jgi:two-component system alkaline phosphatase synthesis response regulator PhoP